MKHQESAFTLIELLVIIAIIGILSGLGITSFQVYRSSAAHSSAQTTMHNAIFATEAGLVDADNPPAAVALVTQSVQGPILDASAADLLPGLMLPKQLDFQVSYDPACIAGACMSQFMSASHCFADQRVQYTRFGDGSTLYLDNLLGGGC